MNEWTRHALKDRIRKDDIRKILGVDIEDKMG